MELSELKIIDLKESILADNDADAEKLRKETADQNVYYINVMSSPGAGKRITETSMNYIVKNQNFI